MSNQREETQPKIGAGHASAMFRQGLAELRGAFFNESNVAQPPQLGLYGTRTPGEIMQDRRSDARDPDEQLGPTLEHRIQESEKPEMNGRDTRELEKE